MNKNYVAIAEEYYRALGNKNLSGLEKYLHPNIRFITPLVDATGKDAYFEAAKNFAAFFNTLTIRAKFGSADQAMIVYDVNLPAPIGNLPSAALLSFQDDLITRIELFYDARCFEKK